MRTFTCLLFTVLLAVRCGSDAPRGAAAAGGAALPVGGSAPSTTGGAGGAAGATVTPSPKIEPGAPGVLGGDGLEADAGLWKLRRFHAQMIDVAFANGVFVGVGFDGMIYRSMDGRTWSAWSVTAPDLQAVVFHDGAFYAGGSQTLLRSEDGLTWVAVEPPALRGYIADLRSSPRGLVLVATLPNYVGILTSEGWQPVAGLEAVTFLRQGAVRGSQIVVNRADGVAVSQDGKTFELITLPGEPLIERVIATPTGYVAASSKSLWGSPDGRTWTMLDPPGATGNVLAVAGDELVFGGGDGALAWSKDGRGWTAPTDGPAMTVDHVLFAEGAYVAIGSAVSTSTDKKTWSAVTPTDNVYLESVAFGAGRFVAVGSEGHILTSSDARTWTSVASGVRERLYGVVFAKGLFVAVAQENRVLTSADGLTWKINALPERPAGSAQRDLRTIAFGNDVFVVGGRDGALATSGDGMTWDITQSHARTDLTYIAFHKGRFFAATNRDGQHFLTSSDASGKTWSTAAVGWNARSWIASNGKILVAPGEAGSLNVSNDGVEWSVRPQMPSELTEFVRERFMAVGDAFYFVGRGGVARSSDGTTYTVEATGWPFDLNAIAEGNGIRVAVGEWGVVMTQPL